LHGALWVKTLSRSWTRGGGAFWRHVLLGGVVSIEPSGLRYFWSIVHGRHRVVWLSAAWQAERVSPSPRDGVLSHGGGWRLSHVRRLWLLAADRGGLLSLVGLSGAVHHRKMALLAQRWRSYARVKHVDEVGLRRWLGIDGDLGTWDNIAHHPDGDKRNGTMVWSTVILRGDESEVQRRKWQGPRTCVIMVAITRQASIGPVSVVALRQMEGGVAAARWRKVPQGDGLPGAVQSVSFGFLST
jgi:hypothetical protein